MATLQLSSSTPTEGSWTPPDLEKALGLADLAPFYSFTIQNESGISQSYSLLSQLPIVKPSVDGITSHTILVARGIATRSGSAYFTIPRDNFYAICGTSHSDTDVQIQVLDKRSVKLGSGTVKNLNPGTTCIVEIASETPAFALSGGHAEDKGGLGAFCIKTGQDFKYQQAKNSRLDHHSNVAIRLG